MAEGTDAVCFFTARVAEAAEFVRQSWSGTPRLGIVLGSGLSGVAEQVEVASSLPYGEIPHLLPSRVLGHPGRLLCGTLAGTQVIVMDGRGHLYEGHSATDLALPIHMMKLLGVQTLIITNAAGGLNPQLAVGDVMVIAEHVNLMGRTADPPVCDSFAGERSREPARERTVFYDPVLIKQALTIARRKGFACRRGVYVGVLGPNYETRAEYRFMRRLAGDAVGMSTVPEVTAAARVGMRVLGLSVITNVFRDPPAAVMRGEDVVATARTATAKLGAIIAGVAGMAAD